jgi:hypothetical protein
MRNAPELQKALLPALYAACFAQVQLEAFRGLPGDRALAAGMVADYGHTLAAAIGTSHATAELHARTTWPLMLRDGLRELSDGGAHEERLGHADMPYRAQRLLINHLQLSLIHI